MVMWTLKTWQKPTEAFASRTPRDERARGGIATERAVELHGDYRRAAGGGRGTPFSSGK